MEITSAGSAPIIKAESANSADSNKSAVTVSEKLGGRRINTDNLDISKNYRQKLADMGIESHSVEEIYARKRELIENREEIPHEYDAMLAGEAAKLKPLEKKISLSEMTDNYITAYNSLYKGISGSYSGNEAEKRIGLLNTAAERASKMLSQLAVNHNKLAAAARSDKITSAYFPTQDIDENIGQRLLNAIKKTV